MEETPTASSPAKSKSIFIYVGILLIILIVFAIGIILYLLQNGSDSNPNGNQQYTGSQSRQAGGDLGDANSADPLERGKALAGGNCTGSGSKELTSAPMHPSDLSVIIPYGLLAGGHVTPIDHQYYWGIDQFGDPDLYDVLAPADGVLVGLQFRDRSNQPGAKVKGDYRGVIMYSCTFFSYFDLATSLSAEIQSQLPAKWESRGNINTNIQLKAGQVIGKVGGQSLDFAVWDTTKSLKNLLVPVAYNNAEPWKIVTVPPLDYFSDEVKQQILPFYARTVEPLDGVIDQDIDGFAVGSWFQEGTNGYAGVFSYGPEGGGMNYWTGHLALVHDHIDPTAWQFSIGELQGEAVQFAIKSPAVAPDKLSVSSGLVKYELAAINYVGGDGNGWRGEKPNGQIRMVPGNVNGIALVQMLDTRKIKVEVFPGKSLSQVSAFTTAARTYDRGDNAQMIVSQSAGR